MFTSTFPLLYRPRARPNQCIPRNEFKRRESRAGHSGAGVRDGTRTAEVQDASTAADVPFVLCRTAPLPVLGPGHPIRLPDAPQATLHPHSTPLASPRVSSADREPTFIDRPVHHRRLRRVRRWRRRRRCASLSLSPPLRPLTASPSARPLCPPRPRAPSAGRPQERLPHQAERRAQAKEPGRLQRNHPKGAPRCREI